MWDWLPIAAAVAAFAAIALLMARSRASSPETGDPLVTRASLPCWEETIGASGGLTFGRGQCFNDTLMEADERAARNEFPIGPTHHG